MQKTEERKVSGRLLLLYCFRKSSSVLVVLVSCLWYSALTLAVSTVLTPSFAAIDCDGWNSESFFRDATEEDVRRCLDEGANPKAVLAGWGLTPLHFAAMHSRDPGVIHALVEAGGSPMASNVILDRTPPSLAAEHNPEPAVFVALWEEISGISAPYRETFINNPDEWKGSGEAWWMGSERNFLGRYLATAIRHNENEAMAASILGLGADPDTTSGDDRMLHIAVRHRSPTMVKAFLEAGANLDARDTLGWTPLHVAASRGERVLIELLLDAGADPKALNGSGMTPTHVAANKGHATALRILQEAAELDGTLDAGCFKWHEFFATATKEAAGRCLASGTELETRDYDGQTAVHHAARNPDAGAMQVLLDAGADPNPPPSNVWGDSTETPLDIALREGTGGTILALLEAGAAVGDGDLEYGVRNREDPAVVMALVDAHSKGGRRAEGLLHQAAAHNRNPDVIRALVEAGEDPNGTDWDVRTALEVALAHKGNDAVVLALIESGATAPLRYGNSETVLHQAARAGRGAAVLEALIKAGADPDARDDSGINALELTVRHGKDAEAIRVLVEAGSDAGDLLMDAALEGNTKGVSGLIEAGVDPAQALLDAASGEAPQLLQVLLDAGADITKAVAEAARLGQIEVLQALFGAGDMNQALSKAAGTEHTEAAQMLLDAGASLTRAISWAADLGRTKEVIALVDLGGNPNEALSTAASAGRTKVVEALLASGADPDARGRLGQAPLYWAMRHGRETTTEVLLRAGAEPSGALGDGIDAKIVEALLERGADLTDVLIEAVRVNDREGIKVLLAAGVDVNAKDMAGKTALHEAARVNGGPTIELLIENGADPDIEDAHGMTPLIVATMNYRERTIDALVQGGSDPTMHFVKAARNGHLFAMHHLREIGADPNARLDGGRTPLHEASAAGQYKAVGKLLMMGAAVDVGDGNGSTPLHEAARSGDDSTASQLIQAGADPTARDRTGRTPWRVAIDLGFFTGGILVSILEAGRDADAGKTVIERLYGAASKGDLVAVKALLAEGASVVAKNAALFGAAGGEHPEVVKALLAAGADVNARDKGRSTPLSYAAAFGGIETMQVLIEAGADPSAKNKNGSTPMYWPVTRGYEDAIRLLVEAGVDAPSPAVLDDLHWARVSCEDGSEVEAYLSRYPSGRHVSAARACLERVGRSDTEDAESALSSVFRDCGSCPELVVVPSGSYMMGSRPEERGRGEDEGPVHGVTISRPFAVGVHEVTVDQWSRFVEEVGHSTEGCWTYEDGEWEQRSDRSWRNPGYVQGASDPVVCVNWHDAKAYVGWLSRETGEGYRLLSEAEWEYVARAGTTTAYHFGSGIPSGQANYNNKEGPRTVPVGSYATNGFGLHDVYGNVSEWVEDCWHRDYSGAPTDGSAWSGDCDGGRVRRGGSWYSGVGNLRSASRDVFEAGYRIVINGFRIARNVSAASPGTAAVTSGGVQSLPIEK